jgi:parvulin-like peptidyl-prolyl isomerase
MSSRGCVLDGVLKRVHTATLALLLTGLGLASTRAEMVEEIVAWVNGDIITLSEYKDEERSFIEDATRKLTGEKRENEIGRVRRELLLKMIDSKILLHHARAIGFDLDQIAEDLLDQFIDSQKVGGRLEFERMLEDEGLTLDRVKQQLLELHTPQEVIRVEVSNRISVSESEIQEYYRQNQDSYRVEGEVGLREIVLLTDNPALKDEKRALAQEIWQRATSGESFAGLAGKYSEAGTRESGGRLGPLKQSELSEVLVKPAFEIPLGTVSPLMETPYGFHIVKVETRSQERVKPLDEVRDEIRNYLQSRKYGSDLEAFLTKLRGEAEWCVKPKYQELLSIPAPPPCERL